MEVTRLYQSAKHHSQWIAFVDGPGWTMFPATQNGWDERRPARGIDPMHLRQVPLQMASGTGFTEAIERRGMPAAA